MRPALCEDALRLGRILAELAPAEPEVHGLVALMEIQASRTRARTGPRGEPVLLLDQDRARWDSGAHSARPRRARARGGARRCGRPVRDAGGDRRVPRARNERRRHGLGAHRRALRHARAAHAIARGRAESRGGGVVRARTGGRPRDRRRAHVGAVARSAIICCRACAATCSPSWDARARPARSSSARPRSPATPASATSCSRARPPSPFVAADRSHWTSGCPRRNVNV